MRTNLSITLLVVWSFVSISALGQESDLFNMWPDTTLAKANSGSAAEYLSEEEKLVIFYINLVRINPSVFQETILKDYLKANDIKKDKDVKALISTLNETSPRVMLQPSQLLTEVARKHARDMGETGRTGHNTSTGETFTTRMQEVSKNYAGLNENANYGNEKALDIVIDLLIDKNVPYAGHRKNILDVEMRYIGVAIEPHARYGFNCVQDFGGHLTK